MTGIGIAGCDGCGCACCKQVWRSTYDCVDETWSTPELFSETADQACTSDVAWHIPADECYAETTIYVPGGTCPESPTTPSTPTLDPPSEDCCCAACCTDSADWDTVFVDVDLTGGTSPFECTDFPTRNYQKNTGTVFSPICSDDCDYCLEVNTTCFLSNATLCLGTEYNCPATAGTCSLSSGDQAIFDSPIICPMYCGTIPIGSTYRCCLSSGITLNVTMISSLYLRLRIVKVSGETFCRLVLEFVGTFATSPGIGTFCNSGTQTFCSVFISNELSSSTCCGTHTLNRACLTGIYCDPFPSALSVTITCLEPPPVGP